MFNIIVTESYDAMSSEAYKIVKETLKKESPVLGLGQAIRRWDCTKS